MIISGAASEFLVLSVRPRFAEAIIDGRKTVEVRRQRPNVQPGTLGFVYSSSPIQAVVGTFTVEKIVSGTPDEIWLVAQDGVYISRREFDCYFAGAKVGHAIVVSYGHRLPKPISLSRLRVIWPKCRPPRSFGYLVAADTYTQRIMSTFRNRLSGDGFPSEESNRNHVDRNGLRYPRGAFLLKGEELRILVSLLAAEDP